MVRINKVCPQAEQLPSSNMSYDNIHRALRKRHNTHTTASPHSSINARKSTTKWSLGKRDHIKLIHLAHTCPHNKHVPRRTYMTTYKPTKCQHGSMAAYLLLRSSFLQVSLIITGRQLRFRVPGARTRGRRCHVSSSARCSLTFTLIHTHTAHTEGQ